MQKLLAQGVARLEQLGFYAEIQTPIQGAEEHDVLDHLLFPPSWRQYAHVGAYIKPSKEGEVYASINAYARLSVGGWEAAGYDAYSFIPADAIPAEGDKLQLYKEAVSFWASHPGRAALAKAVVKF